MAKHNDKEWLREKYVEEALPQTEIAELADCSRSTIQRRMEEFSLQRPWRDEERLRKLYVGQGLSSREIADRLGCGKSSVLRSLKNYGIKTRKSNSEKLPQYQSHTDGRGYMVFRHNDHFIYEHRLLAVASYGIEAVKGMVVHHENGLKWDNRPDNLELYTNREHAKLHAQEGEDQ